MHPTRNDLPEKTRAGVVELLNRRLADAIDLRSQAKQAHWNVKGPNFAGLHELFDEVAGVVDGHVDEIAERATALGGVAEGTARIAAKRSALAEYPHEIASGREHVEALAGALAAFGKSVRTAIDEATALGDQDTADLFTGVSREIDKKLWMVEAHVQAES